MTALHGFLGLPSDWNAVFPEGVIQAPAWLPMLHRVCGLKALASSLSENAGGDVLVGYSMGGRVALHMLVDDGARWRRAVIVSASPGLLTEAEREARAAHDRRWAERFRHDAWERVLEDWEAQAVFAGEPRLPRNERDFDRAQLAAALEKGSVGIQEDLRSALRELQIPVLWVAGERDEKYAAIARECAALNPNFEVRILAGAGHRAPWSATDQFRKAVKEWTQ